MEIISTERLILKLADINDAEFYLQLVNTPKWLQNIGDRNVHSVEDAKRYITNKMLPQHEKLGYGNYTVVKKSDNKKIGSCGLYDREGIDGLDIGFAFLPEYEGKGYAYEASNKLKEIAFSKFNITKISAITVKENLNSQKLLRKLGLKFRSIITIPNDDEELLLFELKNKG